MMSEQERREGVGVRKRVTLAEVAREAGVSVGLVSSYLSGRSYGDGSGAGIRIGMETAGRVLETCRRLGYVPDRVGTYRMIYPERAPVGLAGTTRERFQVNRYHSMILDGVVRQATVHGLNLNVLQYDEAIDYHAEPGALPEWVLAGEVHRLIFAGPPNASLLEILRERGADLVYASRDPEVAGVSAVVPDYCGAAELAVEHLHALGHREIGLFGLPYFYGSYQARELLSGARKALAERSLAEHLHLDRFSGGGGLAPAEEALEAFLAGPNPVTAVFSFDDLSAESLATAALRRGLEIPTDLSIMGCNDERQTALHNPPLTTIRLPVTEIGGRCVEVLNSLAAPRPDPHGQCHVLPVQLVTRASTGPCKERSAGL